MDCGACRGWTFPLAGLYLPVMRSEAPALLPIFRSRTQADLLSLLLLHPERDYTVTEVAGRLGVPLTTLHREAQRLVDADLLVGRTVGRSRLLRANTGHRAFEPLAQLLTVTFGPHTIVADEFAEVKGAELVLIYGSWARRYEGETGPTPHDLDVLVVGRPDRAAVYEAAERAEQRLGFAVNPTIRSVQRWRGDGDALVEQIKSSATVTVVDRKSSG
jgi:predicted nucleotidyltransferase